MVIINKTKITKEVIKGITYARNFENKRYKTFKIIYNGFGLLFGMMLIRYVILQMTGSDQANKVMIWLYGIVTALLLYLGTYGMDRSNRKRFQRLYQKMIGVTFTYEIDSEQIKVTDEEDDSDCFAWDSVIKWNQDMDYIYLFVGVDQCLALSKQGFEQGTDQDLKELVRAVMGLRMQTGNESSIESGTESDSESSTESDIESDTQEEQTK